MSDGVSRSGCTVRGFCSDFWLGFSCVFRSDPTSFGINCAKALIYICIAILAVSFSASLFILFLRIGTYFL